MTLALTFFLSTEMEELLTLRQRETMLKEKVESLERDVGGLEAIVNNLEALKQQQESAKEEHFSLIKRLNCHVYLLYLDAASNRPFVPPDHEPDEDEPVSTYV